MTDRGRRIATLDELKRSSFPSDDSDEDSPVPRLPDQRYYVGGSERSGQLTVDPADRDSRFPTSLNAGTGIFERIIGAAERMSEDGLSPSTAILHLWRDGFSIDDGPFRSTDDGENQRILEGIMANKLPPELKDVESLRIDDRRNEDFPQRPIKAFSGRGRIVGSPTPGHFASDAQLPKPEIPSNLDEKQKQSGKDNSTAEIQLPPFELVDSASEPKTTIAIRFPGGRRIQITVNQHKHTLLDIRNYVVQVQTDLAFTQFDMYAGVPVPRKLQQESLTIAEASLCNSLITIKSSSL